MYKFFGTPNMLVKTRKRKLFDNKIDFKPLFRFDANGEYMTDDEALAEKLKSRFDHVKIESTTQEENELVSTDIKKYTCKKCDAEFENKGMFLAHTRTHKKEE